VIERDHRLSHGRVRAVDAGDGPPLVLLHGLGGRWSNWAANIPALAQRHRVIAPDLPGFGRSGPYGGAVTMERYTDTIVELLDLLGVGRATFVGNSMGGLLTIETAVRHPDRVGAAVLVASGGIPLTSRHHRLIAIPQARAANRLLGRPMSRRAVRSSPRMRRLLARQLVHDPAKVPPRLLASALRGLGAPGFPAALDAADLYDARLRAPAVACPTLILWGQEDRLLPVAMGAELERLIPGSRLVVWEDTGHCPMLEDPPRFDALLAEFAGVNRPAAGAGAPPRRPRSGS
jgi:pimeloyl-ACP methyl ester carboxylesterase